MPDSLGDRMKTYENVSRTYLPRRLPVIIRIDGRAFHTFTKGFQRPFDPVLANAMHDTAAALCKEISGAKLAYTQSDEISILITNNDTIDTQPWFNNNLQKLVSLSAAIATLSFNNAFDKHYGEWMVNSTLEELDTYNTAYQRAADSATFDSRAFVVPPDEVCNYFIWRQQDAVRNSIQMAAQAVYSHKQLDHKNQAEMQEMLFQKGINWNDYAVWQKRGICVVKTVYETTGFTTWEPDIHTPIFTQNREYIERFIPGYKEET